MRVDSGNRERLRSGLLGPLGQEVTDMLMEELDQAGLRKYIDERFAEERRYVDGRFQEVDRRLDAIEKRLDRIEDQITRLATVIADGSRPANAVVYTVCGTVAVVALAALLQSLLKG